MLAAALCAVAGCDIGGPAAEPVGPPLRVLAIEVTTQAPGAAPGVGERVSLAADGTTRPLPTTAIHVRVDRYLDPGSVSRQALCLVSSTAVVTTDDECNGDVLLRPTYDPIQRVASFYLDPAPLAPATFYRVTLFGGEDGLRSFDGVPLEGIFALEFTTADAVPDAPVEAPPTGPLWCGTPECLAACGERDTLCRQNCSIRGGPLFFCASAGCHSVVEGNGPAAMGLDLSSGGAVQATAIGHVAHGTQRGAGAAEADVSSIAFGRAMPIIQPGDPGRSYLLYKIAASALEEKTPAAEGEKDRLREGLVVGMPMPPQVYTPPSADQLDHLVRWIAAGADVSVCP
jgi:hypothetical protein